jgi:predicted small metal-binding protein
MPKNPPAETVGQKLWKIECAPACGFMARCHDQDQLAGFAITHMKKTHGRDLPMKDAVAMMRPA